MKKMTEICAAEYERGPLTGKKLFINYCSKVKKNYMFLIALLTSIIILA